MNLVDELLKADAKAASEMNTGVFKSKRLAKIIGAECETVEVKIREIKNRRVNDILAYQVDKKGNMDYNKLFDSKLMAITEGVVEPDLRSKELQEHFGCKDARGLAEVLFGNEVTALSDAIYEISGITPDEDVEEEVKN